MKKIPIPLDDINIKGLKTLVNENAMTQEQMAEYYSEKLNTPVNIRTIKRRISDLKKEEKICKKKPKPLKKNHSQNE